MAINCAYSQKALVAQPDDYLIRAIVEKGHTECFGILYQRYAHKVYKTCLRYMNSKADAQDALQDIFLKAFEKLSHFRGNSKFSTWLYVIANHHCMDVNRGSSRQKERFVRLDSLSLEHLGRSPFPIREERQRVDMKVLRRSMHRPDREILDLKYQDGFTVGELSQILKISESAVKMRLNRARIRTREIASKLVS